ncbi:GAF domain-containing protein [Amycolatopsis sp. NPDC023774]|uniref:GAF domain-containing protein n=1 Tax=Amycolatopsis sp. NPDC023774 TaxID=3155015 RepID=UPI0033DC9820
MTYNPTNVRRLAPQPDPGVQARMDRLRELGIGTLPDPEFDAIAAKAAQLASTPYAMVNFLSDRQQYFAGLHVPPSHQHSAALQTSPSTAHPPVDRTMDLDHGWCPYVVTRKKALPLNDVLEYPRWKGNPVITKLGIRSYLGAPLIERRETEFGESAVVLGTVCVIDTEKHSWGQSGVDLIKGLAEELVTLIHQRERQGARPAR